MNTITVAPVEGRLILQPELGMRPITGPVEVEHNSFYARAIAQGDLRIVKEEPAKRDTQPAKVRDDAQQSAGKKAERS